MQIVQATFGTYHHFDLARELLAHGHLKRIYSTFPWKRLEREGVPHEYVETYPWLHATQFLLGRYRVLPERMTNAMGYPISTSFDVWITRRIPECDALIAISSAALSASRLVKKRGGVSICDRGSTHRGYQQRVLKEEYARWGYVYDVHEERALARELAIYDEADAIVVPSQLTRRSFIEQGHDPAKVFAIPYGVRLERFQKVADPPSLADRFEVLFVGGVSLRKGIPYLLEAFARVKHPNKRLRIVGGMSPEIEALLPRLPQENVEIVGILPQTELPKIFSESHVLVLPSVEEGLALVQGQALACGCPVIATEATGAEDLFSDGVEGFILPTTDVAQLADCMQQIADDPALQQRFSEAALRRVHHLGGWTTYGNRWVELLHQLTGKA
jgi:starch synthase